MVRTAAREKSEGTETQDSEARGLQGPEDKMESIRGRRITVEAKQRRMEKLSQKRNQGKPGSSSM